MATTVINKYHGNIPPDAVWIMRPSKWGNPFSHMLGTKAQFKVKTREEAVAAFREWLPKQPGLMAALWELKDKVLVCCCHPRACHGHVLAEFADAIEWWEFDPADIRLTPPTSYGRIR